MQEGTARTSTRWGAKFEQLVAGGATVEAAQFCDMKLLAPQELAIAISALTDAPIAGVAVDFTVQLGCGSANHSEHFTVAAADFLAQLPLVLVRSAQSVQVTAVIRSVAGAPKNVKLVVFVAPTAPTWLTEIACEMPIAWNDTGRSS